MSKLKTLPEPLAGLRRHLNECTRDLFEESLEVADIWVDPPDFHFGLRRRGLPFATIRMRWPTPLGSAHSQSSEDLALAVMDEIVEAILTVEEHGPASGPLSGIRAMDPGDEEELLGFPNIRR